MLVNVLPVDVSAKHTGGKRSLKLQQTSSGSLHPSAEEQGENQLGH